MTEKKSTLIVISPNGHYEQSKIDKLSLERAQELIGNDTVQVVPMFDKFEGQSCAVLCDEDGKMKNKPVNNRATLEWRKCAGLHADFLVGDVVVVIGKAARSWR